jgi:hypothetical protein
MAFAATAGLDSNTVGHTLDDIAEADVLVGKEPRQARSISGVSLTTSRGFM